VTIARIFNQTKATELAARARIADRFFPRMWGLLGRSGLAAGEGLVIVPCKSVHAAFMRFPLDVIFLDRQGVVRHQMVLRPWRFSPIVPSAHIVLELPSGVIAAARTAVGDMVRIEPEAPDET
jgi:uncharacterized membrane protein (UPF0127 family)